MQERVVYYLRCPKCLSEDIALEATLSVGSDILEGRLNCLLCRTSYEIENGIPRLLALADDEKKEKKRIVEDFESELDEEYEIERPYCNGRVYKWLLDYKMAKCKAVIGNLGKGSIITISACGSGFDAEYWARWGFNVVATDYSFSALLRAKERANRRGLSFELFQADAENLPFKDRFASVGFVHDGLHHLQQPHRAVHELWRCSSKYVLVSEPVSALATRLAVRLGLSVEYESQSNYVYRFHPTELPRLFTAFGARACSMTRYFMWYQHKPHKLFFAFERDLPFRIFKSIFLFANVVMGRFGNKGMCAASRVAGDF